MSESEARDRRAEQRERYRSAIVDAAGELIRDRLPVKFSVDDLSARADVSRRTIFNHFASLDDVIAAACSRELLIAIDVLEVRGPADPMSESETGSLFEEVAVRLRSPRIPPVVSFLSHALQTLQEGEAYPRRITQEAAARISESLVTQALTLHPTYPRFDVEFLIATLLNGLSLVSRYWVRETGATLDEASLARWTELLDHMLSATRTGYDTRR